MIDPLIYLFLSVIGILITYAGFVAREVTRPEHVEYDHCNHRISPSLTISERIAAAVALFGMLILLITILTFIFIR